MDQGIVQIANKRESSNLGILFFLPHEIVSEILSWLKVKSLLRCKSVCKRWFDMIEDTKFVEMHMRRNKGRFHHFNTDGESFNLDGVEEKVTYINTSNGLLLEKRLSSAMLSPMYRIRNPSTKGILDLPDPPKMTFLMCMYLNSYSGSYKVICGYTNEEVTTIHFDLLDLGPLANDQCPNVFLSWRSLGILCELNRQKLCNFHMLVSGDGILYIRKILNWTRNLEIVCIDLEKEVSTTCTMPQSFLSHNSMVLEFRFMLWNDKPTILSVKEDLKIWVLDDYKKQKWVERVISLPDLELYPGAKKHIPTLINHDEEDMLCYIFSRRYSFGYKLKSKVICQLPRFIFDVAETLLSLKGMKPQNKAA